MSYELQQILLEVLASCSDPRQKLENLLVGDEEIETLLDMIKDI